MTVPARGDGAAAGAHSEADANEPEHPLAPRPPLLVRLGGRWLCRHELANDHPPDGHAPDVQLRP
jgi:hypothetical protein